jgi:hypothetical protein
VRFAVGLRELADASAAFSHCPRTNDPLHFDPMAVGVIPLDDIARLRVLVIHTNFAVGSAIARRLIDADVVALAHASAVLDGNQDPERYDVVLLCPYLPEAHREAVLEAGMGAAGATVIELLDSEDGSRVLMHRAGPALPAAADAVADALELPLVAVEA